MRKSIPVLALLATLSLVACEKVIEVDLNETSPQYVIEANLYDGTNQFQVRVSQTSSYFDSDPQPAITDAAVVLTDQNGVATTLAHDGSGYYSAPVTANAGESYTLEVVAGTETLVASSYLPLPVPLTDLIPEEAESGGFGPGGDDDADTTYLIFCQFTDPITIDNYYRITYDINGEAVDRNEIQVFSDASSNGNLVEIPIQFGQKRFDAGDTISVHLIGLDKTAYDYYLGLSDIIASANGPGGGSAAPGNPINNWSGDALGHFSALSADTLMVVLP